MVRSKIDADQYGRIFAWIGMHLVPGHLPGLENILGFEWSDQTQIEFTNWATGEPNNVDNNEGCGEIYSNGYWNDSPCGKEKNGFVCKAVRPTAVSSPRLESFSDWLRAPSSRYLFENPYSCSV